MLSAPAVISMKESEGSTRIHSEQLGHLSSALFQVAVTWVVEWKQCKRPACKLEAWSCADAAQEKIWLVLKTGSQSVDAVAPEWPFPFTVNSTVGRILRSSKISSHPALAFLHGDFLCFHVLGAPIFLSAPHFYQADQKFVEDIEGMHPKKEYHETFLDINPVSAAFFKELHRWIQARGFRSPWMVCIDIVPLTSGKLY